MFKCGTFDLKVTGLINFNDLKIPCNNYIIVSLIEDDLINDNGAGIRIPCNFEGTQGSDFLIRGGDVAKAGAVIVNAKNYVGMIPGVE